MHKARIGIAVLLLILLSYGGASFIWQEYNIRQFNERNRKYKDATTATKVLIEQFQALSYEEQKQRLRERFSPPITLDGFDSSLINQKLNSTSVWKVISPHLIVVEAKFVEHVSQQEEAELLFLVENKQGQWKVSYIGNLDDIEQKSGVKLH